MNFKRLYPILIQIRRLELELQYARDILTSTKKRYDEEIAAREQSYK